jgi:hypothetical protein
MAKKGRPTKYTTKLAKDICNRLAQGESLQRPGEPLQLVGGCLAPAGFELGKARGADAGARGEGTLAQAAMLAPGADRARAVEDGGTIPVERWGEACAILGRQQKEIG